MSKALRHFILFALFLQPLFVSGQQNNSSTGCPGVPGACGYHPGNPNARSSNPNPSPQNGNNTLGVIYDQAKCGLDYAAASQRLGQRFSPVGVAQPAPFAISGIPACAVIEKAYLWAEGSGNGAAQTATVNGPLGSANYPMTIVGQGGDKCWGYAGSYTYRADVTPSVSGNGTYNISGILTNPPTSGNDMDGATLVVIWSNPGANWQGRVVIADGAIIVNGGTSNYNLPISPAVCGATTNARAFCGIGDIQMPVGSLTLNGTPDPIVWNWWNFEQVNTTVASGATTANFNCNTGGDCFNFCIAGLYFRTTTCATCPTTTAFNVTPTSTPATCSACNGTASVTVSPAGAYTYSWSPAPGSGGNTANPTNMCAGTYTVSVSTSCATVTATVAVTTAGGGVTTTGTQSNVTCNGACDGSASVTVTSGTAPYTYNWTPAPGGGQGSANATGLCAGTYSCDVTDNTGCTGTQTFNITQPTAITITPLQVNVTCAGSCNGSASVNAAGGSGSYTYNWTPAPGAGQGTSTATSLCAGTYTCTIADAAVPTCTVTQTFNITQPTAINIVPSQTDVTCNALCNGTASVAVTGGSGSYTYTWTPAPGAGQGTANATAMCAGSYTCAIADASSPTCTITQTFNITEPAALTNTQSSTDVSCNGACDGTATVNVAGGTAPYSYSWAPNGATTPGVTNLCAGTYTCTVTDANGCTTTATFTITEPTALTVAAAGFNVSCNGACDGQIVAIPNGGTPNYNFSWTTGCSSASCNSVCAGSYTVTVTDLHGCTATASATVTEPAAIVTTTSEVDAHCNMPDGSASANATGGTGVPTYQWQNGGPANANYTGIVPGTYTVVVTDQNNCHDTTSVTVGNIPGATTSITSTTDVSCSGSCDGAIVCPGATGGTAPYTYNWAPAGGTNPSTSNLCPGTYTLTLTDATGCVFTITTTITEPPALTVTATATPSVVCEGQNVQLNAGGSGGTGPYQYGWNAPPMTGATQNITPAVSSTYTAYITDAHFCTDSTTVSVTVNSIPSALFTGDSLAGCAPLCVNFTDLSSQLAPATITQWSWDFGDGNTSTLQNPQHCYTVAGVYSVTLTVTNNGGCTNTIVMSNYIDVYANPVADFSAGPQPTTVLDPMIYFTDLSSGASSWSWNFGDVFSNGSTQQNPSFAYDSAACYGVTLTVMTSNGCVDTTTHFICIDPDVALYVPNAFTPNFDGVNDIFRPQGIGIDPEHYQLWIFDRWGNMIFTTTDWNKGWDGRVQGHEDLCQEDVYVWKIKALDVNGKKHNVIGSVSLIR